MYDIAIAGTAFAILTLVIVRIFEKKVLPTSTKRTKTIKLKITCNPEISNKINDFLIKKFPEMTELTTRNLDSNVKISSVLTIDINKQIKDIYKAFDGFEGVESVSIQEFSE